MPDLKKIIALLKKHYGEPVLPPARGPFELVLWENACYLLSDERRSAVFEGLRREGGLTAEAIWQAPQEILLPHAKAKRALQQFPNIGQPGAEKILMFCGLSAGLPLEWNGSRVLQRIGYARAQKNYGAMYRALQEAVCDQIPRGAAPLSRAHLLLRQHGKTLCRNSRPLCEECPLAALCAFAAKHV